MCVCITNLYVDVISRIKYTTDSNTDFHQQRPAQNLTREVFKEGIQHYILEMDQTTTHRK